jgi:hypothetical protein
VHGLEQKWKEKIQFLHVNFRSPAGKELGRRYEIEHLPALLLLDRAGKVRGNFGMGLRLREEIESKLEAVMSG